MSESGSFSGSWLGDNGDLSDITQYTSALPPPSPFLQGQASELASLEEAGFDPPFGAALTDVDLNYYPSVSSDSPTVGAGSTLDFGATFIDQLVYVPNYGGGGGITGGVISFSPDIPLLAASAADANQGYSVLALLNDYAGTPNAVISGDATLAAMSISSSNVFGTAAVAGTYDSRETSRRGRWPSMTPQACSPTG